MKRFTGIFGFWNFPFLNKFIGPKYSIKDHEVISGSPNYISNYEIKVDQNSKPWTIEMAYDTKVQFTFPNRVATPEVFPKNFRFEFSQWIIEYYNGRGMLPAIVKKLDPK